MRKEPLLRGPQRQHFGTTLALPTEQYPYYSYYSLGAVVS
jgi:hypothetical protein